MVQAENCDISENLYALYLWIRIPNITPEQAFELLETGVIPKRTDITERDILKMIKMHEKLTYKQIGDIYNMDPQSVYKRIARYKKRNAV